MTGAQILDGAEQVTQLVLALDAAHLELQLAATHPGYAGDDGAHI